MTCNAMLECFDTINFVPLEQKRQQCFDALMACAGQAVNQVWLAQIIASWQVGLSVLPDNLGLPPKEFQLLMWRYFPGYYLTGAAVSGIKADFSRMLEKQDLEQFLRRFVAVQSELSESLISMLVAACLGSDHLWQDLGVWSRKDLSGLLGHNFPQLTLLNHKDMKWKKFLYKQLCEAEGIYVCRAPSCEVCKDYPHCFGAED